MSDKMGAAHFAVRLRNALRVLRYMNPATSGAVSYVTDTNANDLECFFAVLAEAGLLVEVAGPEGVPSAGGPWYTLPDGLEPPKPAVEVPTPAPAPIPLPEPPRAVPSVLPKPAGPLPTVKAPGPEVFASWTKSIQVVYSTILEDATTTRELTARLDYSKTAIRNAVAYLIRTGYVLYWYESGKDGGRHRFVTTDPAAVPDFATPNTKNVILRGHDRKVLLALESAGPLTVREIGEYYGVAHTNFYPPVKKLVCLGFIEGRKEQYKGRRVSRYSLTAEANNG